MPHRGIETDGRPGAPAAVVGSGSMPRASAAAIAGGKLDHLESQPQVVRKKRIATTDHGK
jgi:hypothetical protein